MKRKEQSIPLSELLEKTELIKVKKDSQGYWLFGETDPEFYQPQEIKPLQEGENSFEADFKDGRYYLELIVSDEKLLIKLLGKSKKGITNLETFKLNKIAEDEWETIITPQMLFWLSDFNLLKEYENIK